MNATDHRPRVDDMIFRLYDRPVHPELLDTLALREVERGGCRIALRVTTTGHALSWTARGTTLVELTATRDQDLPVNGQRLTHSLDGGRSGRCRIGPRVSYRMQLHVERLDAELFTAFHDELLTMGRNLGLLFRHTRQNGLGLTPLTWIDVTPLMGGLAVSAIHTFPHEFAILKTQSLIEPVGS